MDIWKNPLEGVESGSSENRNGLHSTLKEISDMILKLQRADSQTNQ